MDTDGDRKIGYYLVTLLIELVCGLLRVFLVLPFVLLAFLIFESLASQSLVSASSGLANNAWAILIVTLLIAYANILVSLLAFAGFGGGSLLTRFVLGAREPSTREREQLMEVFRQMADGVDFPIRSFSKLYIIDSTMAYANLIGTTLYISSTAIRGRHLQPLVAHEFGHLHHGDGSLILALRRLVFPPFSLFISGIRDFSTNRPDYKPSVKAFDAMQIFYSMLNAFIFFSIAFIGGGIGVWVMSWAWANYFRKRDYAADAFGAQLGYRDPLLEYLEQGTFYDTSVPYMLGWQPSNELRIDRLLRLTEPMGMPVMPPDLTGPPVAVPPAADGPGPPAGTMPSPPEVAAPVAHPVDPTSATRPSGLRGSLVRPVEEEPLAAPATLDVGLAAGEGGVSRLKGTMIRPATPEATAGAVPDDLDVILGGEMSSARLQGSMARKAEESAAAPAEVDDLDVILGGEAGPSRLRGSLLKEDDE
jgi:Zn-dependent protease with chaperone function